MVKNEEENVCFEIKRTTDILKEETLYQCLPLRKIA